MKDNIKELIFRCRAEYEYNLAIKTAVGFAVTAVFAIFNLVIGAIYGSTWNFCISLYYFLLALIRGVISFVEIRLSKSANIIKIRKNTYMLTSVGFFVMNVIASAPIVMLVFFQREIKFGLIVAIGIAVYTVIKIVATSKRFFKRKEVNSPLLKEVATVDFVDMLVSIVVLQDALVVVNGGQNETPMMILSMVVGGVVMLISIVLSIYNFVAFVKEFPKNYGNKSQDAIVLNKIDDKT